VRFLGCVTNYDVTDASLILEHHYPLDAPPARVLVDVKLLLETIKANETRAGAWLNVIGYVQSTPKAKAARLGNTGPGAKPTATVQAVMLWDAGSLKLADYEKCLADLKAIDHKSKALT